MMVMQKQKQRRVGIVSPFNQSRLLCFDRQSYESKCIDLSFIELT